MLHAAVADVARSQRAVRPPTDAAEPPQPPEPGRSDSPPDAARPPARAVRRPLGRAALVELVAFCGLVLLSVDAMLALVAERPLQPGHWFVVGLMGLMLLAALAGAGLAVARAWRVRRAAHRRRTPVR